MRIDLNHSPNAMIFGVLFAAAIAAPAAAADVRTRLVDCKAGSCLLVTGDRADAGSTVRINGHDVVARGARKWRVSVPVDTVRAWSVPYARTITVSIAGSHIQATLPIGLLGHQDLAFLAVYAK